MSSPPDFESTFNLLFAASPIPMWVFDTENLRFLEVNEAAVANYGYSREEFLGMTIADIRPAEDVPALREELAALCPSGSQGPPRARGLWRHRRKDGTLVSTQITVQDLAFLERSARLVVAQDLSQVESLTAELRNKDRLLQSILDELPAVVFVKDLAGRFVLVNRAWERFAGVPGTEAATKTVHDIFPPEVAERLQRSDLSVLNAAAPQEAEDVLPSEQGPRTYLTTLFRLSGESGRVERLVGLALDITERKRAEEQQARLSRVVEQASESIVITDPQGTIIYVNPAFESVSGYSRAEAIGQNPRVLKSGHHDAAFYRRMWETLSRGEVWKGRMVNRRKDGTLFQEDATVGPVRDASGRLVNYVAVKRDVTNETRLERQLLQAQKMEAVGRLAGGVAHDFNNLLGVITGYGEMARQKLRADDPLRGKVDQILKAAERAAGLTRQLLAFSRQQVLQPRVLDLNALVTEVEKMLRRLIGEDVELGIALAPRLGRVRADPGQLEQILMNLAVNARDAMPEGGRLRIETRNAELGAGDASLRPTAVPGPYVLLAVTDTGSGMDAETQAHLFEPFFTTKELGKGTGLGLSTVYGIVQQSGGHISCQSEVGVGTTFTVYLPRIDEEPAAANGPRPAELAPGHETLLLIEDDPELRDVLCETLEAAGYTVLVAQDGAQALRLSGEYAGAIPLIVTDVIMPGLTGPQVAEKLKAVRPESQILYISGYTGDAVTKHGVHLPGVALLSKPFTPHKLLDTVREMLDTG